MLSNNLYKHVCINVMSEGGGRARGGGGEGVATKQLR